MGGGEGVGGWNESFEWKCLDSDLYKIRCAKKNNVKSNLCKLVFNGSIQKELNSYCGSCYHKSTDSDYVTLPHRRRNVSHGVQKFVATE